MSLSMGFNELKELLVSKNLKVTPQRIVVLQACLDNHHHPRAEEIIEKIHKSHPNIATGTVYKILDTYVEKGILRKVKTDRDAMRYDPILEQHHHIYCSDSDRIEDYFDDDLNQMLADYFKSKDIPGFRIEDIKLQINGKFINQPE